MTISQTSSGYKKEREIEEGSVRNAYWMSHQERRERREAKRHTWEKERAFYIPPESPRTRVKRQKETGMDKVVRFSVAYAMSLNSTHGQSSLFAMVKSGATSCDAKFTPGRDGL